MHYSGKWMVYLYNLFVSYGIMISFMFVHTQNVPRVFINVFHIGVFILCFSLF